MAVRPVFVPLVHEGRPDVAEHAVEFEWFPGFSFAQKQRSIQALHKAAVDAGVARQVLEISSKSQVEDGRRLSAFALMVTLANNVRCPMECAFQGSKVFEQGGPYVDLFCASPRDAKRDPRLSSSGRLLRFELLGQTWPLLPTTAFYDWLYGLALAQNPSDAACLSAYDAYTDIEFNPARSVNCQARAAALHVATLASRAS